MEIYKHAINQELEITLFLMCCKWSRVCPKVSIYKSL